MMHITLDKLYEKENGICFWCGQLVGKKKASREHLIPIANGGKHGLYNLRLAHKKCNFLRGDTHLLFVYWAAMRLLWEERNNGFN